MTSSSPKPVRDYTEPELQRAEEDIVKFRGSMGLALALDLYKRQIVEDIKDAEDERELLLIQARAQAVDDFLESLQGVINKNRRGK